MCTQTRACAYQGHSRSHTYSRAYSFSDQISIVQWISVVNNPPANTRDSRDAGSIPVQGRSLGGGNGNPLQYSCLGNPMNRGAWLAISDGEAKSQTWLNDREPIHTPTHTLICLDMQVCGHTDTCSSISTHTHIQANTQTQRQTHTCTRHR